MIDVKDMLGGWALSSLAHVRTSRNKVFEEDGAK